MNIVGPVANISPGLAGGVYAAFDVSAPTAIKASPGYCARICVQADGDITVNDSATTSGASASNQIYSGSVTAGQVVPLLWPCSAGIVVSAVTSATVAISFT